MEAESMSKKSLKISIEEEVLEKAKKHIPNHLDLLKNV